MSNQEAFWRVHDSLPQQAPGSEQTTLYLLQLAGNPTGTCLDIGCGQGRSSLLLTNAGLDVVAIDTHLPFLDQLRASAQTRSLEDTLTIKNAPMEKLDYSDASFDLVWSEGAAYLMGLENALRSWRRLLTSSGVLVVTECCWMTDVRSAEVQQYWAHNYPDMPDPATITDWAVDLGYEVLNTYTLPRSDWDDYYLPMKDRVAALENTDVTDIDMRTVLQDTSLEIKMYEEYGDEYGYVGFVLRKND